MDISKSYVKQLIIFVLHSELNVAMLYGAGDSGKGGKSRKGCDGAHGP